MIYTAQHSTLPLFSTSSSGLLISLLHLVVTALPVLEVSGNTPLAMMAPMALLRSLGASRSRLWLITWPGRMRGIRGHF